MHATPDILVAEFTPELADQRVNQRFRAFIVAIISLVISLIIAGIIVYLRRDDIQGVLPWVVIGIAVGIQIVRLVIDLVRWRLAVRERRDVGIGAALVVGRFGLELDGKRFDWSAVRGIGTSRKRFYVSPLVQVQPVAGGSVDIALDHLDVLPAALDSAVRIFSGGRLGVDLAAVDD